ncbi:spermine/spermidine N-acetyltransferase [Chitinophaga jiangningensis]|uniref:Spermine/spermidine N-acetyltransferase n=1 Tax=Chitinophaga jiangningensis TaxID=1419482 RepID=A0A1M6ZZT1_9BACT|nr:GNAT family N-acetyltransferase [Chitinophaga jiangningensis]SHL35977.1 spermine/spermidine N-acetyltransferase [Chitinophaga jiangningensis]
MELIEIRKANIADIAALAKLARNTFFETFAASNSEADMQQYLEEHFNEATVHNEVSNPDSLFYMAWENDVPVGYLKLNTGNAQTELKSPETIEIERIYVLHAWHGKKVGQLLYEKAIEIARALQKHRIWLGVWEENPRAIRFYEKNGFVTFDKHTFILGKEVQTDLMMHKTIE